MQKEQSDPGIPRIIWLIEQGLTSHSTHFRSFRKRWGDCGISQEDCSRSQSPQCVRCWVVCARPLLDNSGVYVYYLKRIVLCPYVLDARLWLWVSLEHAQSTTNQAEQRSSATHLLARWEHERTTACRVVTWIPRKPYWERTVDGGLQD